MSASVRTADQELELRERIVEVLDAIDRGDPGTATFYARGIPDDLDAAVAEADE